MNAKLMSSLGFSEQPRFSREALGPATETQFEAAAIVDHPSMSSLRRGSILIESSDSRRWTKPCWERNSIIGLSFSSGIPVLTDRSWILCNLPSTRVSRMPSSTLRPSGNRLATGFEAADHAFCFCQAQQKCF